MMAKRKRKNQKIGQFLVLVIMVVLCVGVGAYFLLNTSTPQGNNKENKPLKEQEEKTPKQYIVDPNSDTRNIAVMINNIKRVWNYQSGLQDAHIVYEIITEGGITRLMAIYKDKNTERIGSIRSARIYYLDYVLENDAIYVHVGGSKEALRDIKTLQIPDLNAQTIWRDKSLGLSSEHTAFTSIERINEKVKSRKMRNTTTKKNLLAYNEEDIDLSKLDGAIPANDIYISYSGVKSTTFKYDSENKVYKRYQNDIPHIDYVTKEQYTAKNIITYQVKNRSYDSYGRQELDNIGSGNGYYISNGYAVPITWEKTSRSSQTIYRYLNGEEIKVNDGNTYIQIQPLNRKLTIN